MSNGFALGFSVKKLISSVTFLEFLTPAGSVRLLKGLEYGLIFISLLRVAVRNRCPVGRVAYKTQKRAKKFRNVAKNQSP